MLRRSLVVLLLTLSSAAAPAAEPPKSQTLLLVDDHHVLYRAGTRRVLHPAERRQASPLIAEEHPWELTVAWTSVYRHPQTGKYQLWYQAYAGKRGKEKRMECTVAYAESADGIKFTKPMFKLFPFNDIAETNIVMDGGGGYGDHYGNCVLVDEREPDAARRYKMMYYDWTTTDGREEGGLHAAFSPDGVHWTKHPQGPLLKTAFGGRGLQPPLAGTDALIQTPYKGAIRKQWAYPLTMSDAGDVCWDAPRGLWTLYGKMWISGPDGGLAWKHAMGRSESRDFLYWTKPQLVVAPDDLDPPELEFHTSPVFFYGGVYFGLNQILNRKAGGTMNIELMTSRDGIRWERPFRGQWFLARGAAGSFDAGSIFSNSTPVVLDDEIRFYYGAYDAGAVGGGAHIISDEQRSGVGLAVIPRDRFAGIATEPLSAEATLKKPLEHVGQVTLKPLDLAGVKELSINADAKAGTVRVELLDADGYRVPGFTRDDAVPLAGDSLRHAVAWKQAKLADLKPGEYSLRLHLQKATLYAVTLQR